MTKFGHDLRNKLTPLSTVVGLIQEYKKADEKKKKVIVEFLMGMEENLKNSLDSMVEISKKIDK